MAREKLNTKKVELAFNSDKNIMRIKSSENNGMEIKKTKLFGKGFFNQFEITKKGKFEAEYDPKENALYVKL